VTHSHGDLFVNLYGVIHCQGGPGAIFILNQLTVKPYTKVKKRQVIDSLGALSESSVDASLDNSSGRKDDAGIVDIRAEAAPRL
jgi:hypothetical protein